MTAKQRKLLCVLLACVQKVHVLARTRVLSAVLSVKGKTTKITFIYIDLKNKTDVTIELTPDLVKEYEEKLADTANKINNSDFLKKSKDCNCEYKIICY